MESGATMRNKYRNRKVKTAEGEFDSEREYRRWRELRLLERAGKISCLRRQEKFVLIPSQHETYTRYSGKTGKRLKDGKRCVEKECSYVADFVYLDEDCNIVVEDAKGVRTDDYIIKRKLMLWIHGIRIKES